MDIQLSRSKKDLGCQAAEYGAAAILKAIAERGSANIIIATGASQFEVIEHLVDQDEIHWPAVTVFHLDEYVGLPITHPASFRLYLWKRFVSKLPMPLKAFHYLDGEHEAEEEAARVSQILARHPIDVAFVGIGENGHLAFNDPPADFDTQQPYLVVDLDEDCRKQQLGEGWFPTLADVPTRAISMSIQQILKSQRIVCSVPDERKAQAVRSCIEGPVTNQAPASILQQHDDCTIFLDAPAASRLKQEVS